MVVVVCRSLLIGVLAVVGISGCATLDHTCALRSPDQGWLRSTPEERGIDSAALAAMLDQIRDDKLPLHSLLIVRHGYLVLEAYFYPYSGKTPHAWASVTKSITATLVGRALDEGHIRSLDQPIVDFFPQQLGAAPEAKKRITVEQLLKMATGLECGYRKGEPEALAMERSPDFVQAVLDLPLMRAPGSEFAYCSGATHLLSAIVTRATGMSALKFAQRGLFAPLGVAEVGWPADPQGNNYGWTDLRMHPKDMAKIGYLYLRRGRWCGEQILSSDWVRRATRRQIDTGKGDADYGYGWWALSGELSGAYEARGRGGQSIVVWPQKDILVVMNGAGPGAGELVPFFRSALRSDRALPKNPPAFTRLTRNIAAAAEAPKPLSVPPLPNSAREVSGRLYQLEHNLLDLKTLSLRFAASNEAVLEFLLWKDPMVMRVGLDGLYRFSTSPSKPTIAAKGEWRRDDEFVIDFTEADGINHFRIGLSFKDEELTIDIEDVTRHFPDQRIQAAALPN